MRVLVADDNSDAADTLAALIGMELGCVVSVAYDGRSALQRALAEQPDVLILDIRMPEFGGVEVAREVARARGGAAVNSEPVTPLLLAVTGTDVSGSLADIDSHFHGAFAKPVDGDALVSLLRRHWHGEPDARRHAPTELSDLLCRVARESVPVLGARGQSLSFDYRGPSLVLQQDDAALHAGLYRLLCAITDMVDAGSIELQAHVRPEPFGSWALSVEVTAFANVLAPPVVSEVFAWLGLTELSDQRTSGLATRTAGGICPSSGARVHCRVAPAEGVQLRFELRCQPQQVLEPSVDAGGAQAWIVDARDVPSAMLERRLRRLGWSVRRWPSLSLAHAAALRPAQTMPAVLIAADSEQDGIVDMAALQSALPRPVHCIHLVPIGSTALRGRDSSMGCSVQVDPLSPGELITLTRTLLRPEQPDGLTAGAGEPQPRPQLLVVDDMEVNRVVASGLAQALGYDVALVADGLDAIRYCSESPPDVVLMDINMAVVGGIDATQRIRLLQRLGRIPPFPIVAATANDDQATADRCRLVGMDGFLTKPLMLQALREELRRVTVNAPH
jgi:CheY-like chemotaxis protein